MHGKHHGGSVNKYDTLPPLFFLHAASIRDNDLYGAFCGAK